MKRYTMSFADSLTHKPEHPERTAKRMTGTGVNFDVCYQVWTNRAAMLTSIRAQHKYRSPEQGDWMPCVREG